MRKPFFILFLMWLGVWLFAELGYSYVTAWVASDGNVWPLFCFTHPIGGAWLLFMALLAVLEVVGLIMGVSSRPCEAGDTLSELIRAFLGDGWAARAIGAGIGLAIGARIATLPFLLNGVEHPMLTYAPWVALSAGVAAWLFPHFHKVAMNYECFSCGAVGHIHPQANGDLVVECTKCGTYQITGDALKVIEAGDVTQGALKRIATRLQNPKPNENRIVTSDYLKEADV